MHTHYETLNQKIVARGRAFNVRNDTIRLPNGEVTEFNIVDHADSVTVVPVDADGGLWFVRQYRVPAAQSLLELPAGVLEPGEDAASGAQRELREEIGMAAAQLIQLSSFYLAAGYCTEYMTIFLALELSPSPLPQDADEFLTLEKYTLAQALQKMANGDLPDAKTQLALLLTAQYLNKQGD